MSSKITAMIEYGFKLHASKNNQIMNLYLNFQSGEWF